MNVNAVCNHHVATIDPHAGVVEAAARMRAEHVGDLIVVTQSAGRRVPIGILTDRDIAVGVVARGVSPSDVTVQDAMSPQLLKVEMDTGLEFALREMRRVGVRRVPVVDENDDLVGVLSIDDAIDYLAEQFAYIADIVRLGQQNEPDTRP